ncbi:hypothetical protein DL546_002414 [Coniochaeta pulveracea]|uniref:Uncharacterized protein n=1 Tax=Coniochaeta pulveracea TaxID=177199 RepID=A0A420XX05_9PEZI|nr:hypothetical protein DL546_002414 [Coniochaeta pulveracea]
MSPYGRSTQNLDERVEMIAPSQYHADLRARRAWRTLEEDIAYTCVSICQSYHDVANNSTPATPPARRTSRRVNYQDLPVMVECGRDVYLGSAGEFNALPRTVIPPRTLIPPSADHETSSPTANPHQAALRNPTVVSSSSRQRSATQDDDDGEANLVQLDRKMALMQLKGQMSRRGTARDDFYEWLKTPAGRRAARLTNCAPAPLRIRKQANGSAPGSHGYFLETGEDEDDEIFKTLLRAVRERPGSARDRSLTAALAMMSQPLNPLIAQDLSTINGSVLSRISTNSGKSGERTPPSSPPEPKADSVVGPCHEITRFPLEEDMPGADSSMPTTKSGGRASLRRR